MNPILTSFLCGLAFIGGAFLVCFLVIFTRNGIDKAYREELSAYWRDSISLHKAQIACLKSIREAIDHRNKKD